MKTEFAEERIVSDGVAEETGHCLVRLSNGVHFTRGSLIASTGPTPLRLSAASLPGWQCPTDQQFRQTLPSVDEWADRINQSLLLQTIHRLDVGRLVYACKLRLKRGQWEELFRRRREKRLRFSKTTGKKWVQIGKVCGPIGQEPDHLNKLPVTFEALYQLSRLGPDLLLQAIREREVYPELSEGKAKDLVERYRPDLKPKPRRLNVGRCIQRMLAQVQFLASEATAEERESLAAAFREMGEMLNGPKP